MSFISSAPAQSPLIFSINHGIVEACEPALSMMMHITEDDGFPQQSRIALSCDLAYSERSSAWASRCASNHCACPSVCSRAARV